MKQIKKLTKEQNGRQRKIDKENQEKIIKTWRMCVDTNMYDILNSWDKKSIKEYNKNKIKSFKLYYKSKKNDCDTDSIKKIFCVPIWDELNSMNIKLKKNVNIIRHTTQKEINEKIKKEKNKEIRKSRKWQYEKRFHFNKKEYSQYLKSKRWIELRDKCIKKYKWRCAWCNNNKNLQAHHRCYDNLWKNWEIDDLVCLCDKCHHAIHKNVWWNI